MEMFEAYEGTCRSCGAGVFWAETEKGKRMPVDREPAENGNIRLLVRTEWPAGTELEPGETKLVAVYDTQKETLLGDEEPRFVSHFATCAQARSWRKG